jgi:hypothetical protein
VDDRKRPTKIPAFMDLQALEPAAPGPD